MSWINTIAQGIENAFNAVRPALKSIPPLLSLCEVVQTPGLSAIATIGSIIKRMPEAGIETGVNPCGAPNVNNKLIRIVCEEVIKEIKYNSKFTCVIAPKSITSIGTGANASGTIVVKSYNTMPVITNGIIK